MGGTEDVDNGEDIHEDLTLPPTLPPPARATPVNGGHRAEYGCRAEEHGIRANRMPNPKRSEIALGTKKGVGSQVL